MDPEERDVNDERQTGMMHIHLIIVEYRPNYEKLNTGFSSRPMLEPQILLPVGEPRQRDVLYTNFRTIQKGMWEAQICQTNDRTC